MLSLLLMISPASASYETSINSAIEQGQLVVSGQVVDVRCQSFEIEEDDLDLRSYYQGTFVVDEVLSGELDAGEVEVLWMDLSFGLEGPGDGCYYNIQDLSEGWSGALVLEPTPGGAYEYSGDYDVEIDDYGTEVLPACGEDEQDAAIAAIEGDGEASQEPGGDPGEEGAEVAQGEAAGDEAAGDEAAGCSATGAGASGALWLAGLVGLRRRTGSR